MEIHEQGGESMSTRRRRNLTLALSLLGLCLTTTASSPSYEALASRSLGRQGVDAPSRRELLRNQYRHGRLLVVTPYAESPQRGRLEESIRRGLLRRSMDFDLVSGERVNLERLRGGPVAIVGHVDWIRDHPLLDAAMEALAPRLPEGGGAEEVTRLFLPSPWNSQFPMNVVAGSDDDAIIETLGRRRRADIHRLRGGRTVAMEYFDRDWRPDPTRSRRFSLSDAPHVESEVARIHLDAGAVDGEPLEDFVRSIEGLRSTLRELYPAFEPTPMTIHVYPDLETKGLVTESSGSGSERGSGIDVVLGLDTLPLECVASELLRQLPLEADESTRAGLAVALSASPEGLEEIHRTAAALVRTSDPPRLAEWGELSSPIVRRTISGSLADYAMRQHDRLPERLEPFEPGWLRAIAKLEREKRNPPSTGFHRGMTFSHEGYQIFNGYGSKRASESVSRLASLGVDAMSVIPYAFMDGPSDTEPLPIPVRPGSETDEGVRHAVRAAKGSGMHVLLKPQIWMRGGWPGDIAFDNEEDESSFQRSYLRWIRHYALLAQQEGVPLFAVGTEMKQMSFERREFWKRIIEDVRAVYDGKLVYAANWGEEVEHVDFWDLLDYIGCDFYYPLSLSDEPTDAELALGFEQALDKLGDPIQATPAGRSF